MTEPLRMGVLGIDHRHIFTQIERMQAVGAELVSWWSEGTPETLDGFVKRYPDAPRHADQRAVLEDDSLDLILIAAIPADRADLAIAAMRHGKDVMTDKPGCTTLEQLANLRACVAQTGRIWSIDFSERFEVEAVTRASELVQAGAIGEVIQTLGIGPHRLNRATRPDWFFQRERYGGILVDIASHQIDQFLHFTGASSAEITLATAINQAHPGDPGLQDFGQIALQSGRSQGYIKVDWFTPDALPTWGDGRLFLTGTEGTLELRKYTDVGGRSGANHLFLVNGTRCEHIDATGAGYPYFAALAHDIRTREATAMGQDHAFTVMELALNAQAMAERT
ncbi:MAG: Gfo/Idh/MocA family protein [Sedimentitalea sp.]